jgi:uncharacterized protein YegP (UPF0339 family)
MKKKFEIVWIHHPNPERTLERFKDDIERTHRYYENHIDKYERGIYNICTFGVGGKLIVSYILEDEEVSSDNIKTSEVLQTSEVYSEKTETQNLGSSDTDAQEVNLVNLETLHVTSAQTDNIETSTVEKTIEISPQTDDSLKTSEVLETSEVYSEKTETQNLGSSDTDA